MSVKKLLKLNFKSLQSNASNFHIHKNRSYTLASRASIKYCIPNMFHRMNLEK